MPVLTISRRNPRAKVRIDITCIMGGSRARRPRMTPLRSALRRACRDPLSLTRLSPIMRSTRRPTSARPPRPGSRRAASPGAVTRVPGTRSVPDTGAAAHRSGCAGYVMTKLAVVPWVRRVPGRGAAWRRSAASRASVAARTALGFAPSASRSFSRVVHRARQHVQVVVQLDRARLGRRPTRRR